MKAHEYDRMRLEVCKLRNTLHADISGDATLEMLRFFEQGAAAVHGQLRTARHDPERADITRVAQACRAAQRILRDAWEGLHSAALATQGDDIRAIEFEVAAGKKVAAITAPGAGLARIPALAMQQMQLISLLGCVRGHEDDVQVLRQVVEPRITDPKTYRICIALMKGAAGDAGYATELLEDESHDDLDKTVLARALQLADDDGWVPVIDQVLALSTDLCVREMATGIRGRARSSPQGARGAVVSAQY